MAQRLSIKRSFRKNLLLFSFIYFVLIWVSHDLILGVMSNETSKHRLEKEAEKLHSIIARKPEDAVNIQEIIDRFQLLLEHAVVIRTDDYPPITSDNLDEQTVESILSLPEGFFSIKVGTGELLGIKKALSVDDREISIGILEMDSFPGSSSLLAHSLALIASAILLAALLILIALSIHLSLHPIRAIQRDLVKLESGQQSRLSTNVPEEFGHLIDQFNTILDQSGKRLERHRNLNADISHRIKTSLAANLAILLDAEASSLIPEDISFMRRNLADLIEALNYSMSKADISGRQIGQNTRPVMVTSDVIRVMEKIFPDRRFSLLTDLPDEFNWQVEHHDFSEMIGNLLENAGKWARSLITVTLRVSGGDLIIQVHDDGEGIPDQEAGRVTERGTRLDEIGPGFGLGLAIVKDIVEDNLGSIRFSTPAHGGTEVIIVLPTPD